MTEHTNTMDGLNKTTVEIKEAAPRRLATSTCSSCVACGSKSEPYFSRIDPMGYFCPDCGHEDGKPYQPEKPFHGFVGEWVACSEEMPDDEITVLVWFGDDATLAFHDTEIRDRRGDSGWIMAGGSRVLLGVTHWCREIRQPNETSAGTDASEKNAMKTEATTPLAAVDQPRLVRPLELPRGIYQRTGIGGTGVQLYRIVGSALGDMESPIGYGRDLHAAIEDAKDRGNWPNDQGQVSAGDNT